ncbi:GroES-like protein [Trichoderma austrokoningii]
MDYLVILGSDAAGEIVAIGPDVSNFSVGERAFFQGIIGNNDASTFQQYVKIDAALVAKTPGNISDDQASGIMLASLAILTAYYDKTGHGLPAPWDKGGDQIGNGAATVISGFSKIITNSSPAHQNYLQNLGATVVLDREATPGDFAATIGDNVPLDFILHIISAKSTRELSVVLPEVLDFENFDGECESKITFPRIIGLGSLLSLRYLSEPFAKYLGGDDGYIARGLFEPNRPVIVPGGLNGVEAALAKNKKGVSGEKVVIRPFE